MTQQHWVSVWGNAVSVAENRPERYAKNITIRYPILIPFNGTGIRLTFDNYCGTEPITLSKVTVLHNGLFHAVFFEGNREVTIGAGERAVSDPLMVNITESELIDVSFYLKDFTQMRSVVFTTGPLSIGSYAAFGDVARGAIAIGKSEAQGTLFQAADLNGQNFSLVTEKLEELVPWYLSFFKNLFLLLLR